MSGKRELRSFAEMRESETNSSFGLADDRSFYRRVKRNEPYVLSIAAAVLFALIQSCDEDSYIGELRPNVPPVVRLTSGPVEGDTSSYAIRFSWIGNDSDGKVDYYEFAICEGDPIGFDPADTMGADKWIATRRTDSLFKFKADSREENFKWSKGTYTRFRKTHTFFIRAVDDRGARSQPAYRSFTAETVAPIVKILTPRNSTPGQTQIVPPIVKFTWKGEDPIDEPWNTQEVDSIRYMLIPMWSYTLADLNANPEAYEKYWTPWIYYHAPGDSGIATVIGDDEILSRQNAYIFAVQAKDEAGAVTCVFDPTTNVRLFWVLQNAGPVLRVSEKYLGKWQYVGKDNLPLSFRLPAGFVLNFSWSADASSYGGEVSYYRYGWDIVDYNDPGQWDVEPSPYVRSAPPISFNSGVHTLFIEAVDNNNASTLAQMEVAIFPASMTYNLLWVDDFYSTDDFQNMDNAFPTESQHDAFWIERCSRAVGFSPTRDVFDTATRDHQPPDIETLWQYKNIIWSYSSSDQVNAWDDMVRFIPESAITPSTQLKFNFLAYYMSRGGHIWTEGKSDAQGGLIAVLYPRQQVTPINLRCEITGPRTGCDGDTSGVNTIAYRDYCVTVIDKMVAILRSDPRMPTRRTDWDAMKDAYLEYRDSETQAHPGLPQTLRLWSGATAPGMYFDPQVRGFTYGEVYNPGYWMSAIGEKQQGCFHPMYRMRALSTRSVVDNATIAFWSTKYSSVIADAPGAFAAPNVHFGVPLWFFDRAEVDSIADVIFRAWGISGY